MSSSTTSDSSVESEDNIFSMERIEKSRTRSDGRVEYYIKWEGYPASENSWEPEINILYKAMIQEFNIRQKTEDESFKVENGMRNKMKLSASTSKMNMSNEEKMYVEMEKKREEMINNKKQAEREQVKKRQAILLSTVDVEEEELVEVQSKPGTPPTLSRRQGQFSSSSQACSSSLLSNKEKSVSAKKFAQRLQTSTKSELVSNFVSSVGESPHISVQVEEKKSVKLHKDVNSLPASISVPAASKEKTYYEMGYKVASVMGICRDDKGQHNFLVNFKDLLDGDHPILELVNAQLLKVNEPAKVIQYYESIITFEKMDGGEGSGGRQDSSSINPLKKDPSIG